jgi:RimJ/RimL family protein N-acetyltransferase
MIETERLILRPFRETDGDAAFQVNGDSRVSDWLGGPLDRAASDAMIDRCNAHIRDHGFGFWAAEYRPEARLIGMIGVRHMPTDLPPAPAIEAGWRLAFDYWGRGLASEGAAAAIAWAFKDLATQEVIAITAVGNLASQRVMRRCGMIEDPLRRFAHPRLAEDHPLRQHVVYVARASSAS